MKEEEGRGVGGEEWVWGDGRGGLKCSGFGGGVSGGKERVEERFDWTMLC